MQKLTLAKAYLDDGPNGTKQLVMIHDGPRLPNEGEEARTFRFEEDREKYVQIAQDILSAFGLPPEPPRFDLLLAAVRRIEERLDPESGQKSSSEPPDED